MANTILNSSVIAKESLRILENQLVFARGVNRQYEKEFEAERKVGDTINVRKRSKYTVRSGATASVQNHEEVNVPVVVDSQKGVDVEFTSKELAMNLDDFSKQVLQPQIAALANQVDLDGLMLYKKVANAVGTPGSTPTAIKTYATASAKLDDEACPSDDNRSVIINPMAQVEIIDSLKGLFQSSSQIKEQYERGKMGMAAGFDWSMSQNIPVHTIGALGGTPLVNGAGQTGSTLVTDGWSNSITGILKQGDVFYIAGVYAVNPQSRQTTGQLRQFVVTSDVASNGSGQASIGIFPAIVATGAKQTVTAVPADNAAITVLGAANTQSPTNLAYHKDAFTLVTVDLPLPKGMDMASRASSAQAGLSIRFVRGYDILNDKFISRLDVLYGWAAIYPELACRIQG